MDDAHTKADLAMAILDRAVAEGGALRDAVNAALEAASGGSEEALQDAIIRAAEGF